VGECHVVRSRHVTSRSTPVSLCSSAPLPPAKPTMEEGQAAMSALHSPRPGRQAGRQAGRLAGSQACRPCTHLRRVLRAAGRLVGWSVVGCLLLGVARNTCKHLWTPRQVGTMAKVVVDWTKESEYG
jgi:hypothetical protein